MRGAFGFRSSAAVDRANRQDPRNTCEPTEASRNRSQVAHASRKFRCTTSVPVGRPKAKKNVAKRVSKKSHFCTSPPYNIKEREISVVGVLPARDLPSWCPCGWFLEFYHGLVYGLWLLSLPRLRRGARHCENWYSEKYKLDLPLSVIIY